MNREILFRGKEINNEKWHYGDLLRFGNKRYINICPRFVDEYIVEEDKIALYSFGNFIEVIPETIGRYTGLTDRNGVKIFEGDIVELFVFRGQIIQMCGAFGVSVEPAIDWDYLASEINPVTGCDNSPFFCQNDNFVSLWELMWNYNQEENMCDVIEVIGNIHDNPELLGGIENKS